MKVKASNHGGKLHSALFVQSGFVKTGLLVHWVNIMHGKWSTPQHTNARDSSISISICMYINPVTFPHRSNFFNVTIVLHGIAFQLTFVFVIISFSGLLRSACTASQKVVCYSNKSSQWKTGSKTAGQAFVCCFIPSIIFICIGAIKVHPFSHFWTVHRCALEITVLITSLD